MSPAARALGVLAPEIVAVLPAGDLAPVPLVVSRYLPGRALAPSGADADVRRAVGGQVALLHAAGEDVVPGDQRSFRQHRDVDPATVVDSLRRSRRLDPEPAAALRGVRDRLAPFVLPDDEPVFCHGDLHAGNVLAASGRLTGVVDLAGAGWLDGAWDFAAIPAAAIEPALDGYGAAGGRTTTLRERIARCRFQLAVHRLAQTNRSEAAASAIRGVDAVLAAG